MGTVAPAAVLGGWLAVPGSPFRSIVTDPPPTLATTSPWCGVPVPVALALHLPSLAQLLRHRPITLADQRPSPG